MEIKGITRSLWARGEHLNEFAYSVSGVIRLGKTDRCVGKYGRNPSGTGQEYFHGQNVFFREPTDLNKICQSHVGSRMWDRNLNEMVIYEFWLIVFHRIEFIWKMGLLF
jgi:hypothetical protein